VAVWKIISVVAPVTLGIAVFIAAGLSEFGGSVDPLVTQTAIGGPLELEEATSARPEKVVAAGEIDVDGGTIPLAPQVPGAVIETPVEEGDLVKQGQPLLRLDSRLAELQVDQASAAFQEASAQLLEAKQARDMHLHLVRRLEQSVVVAESRLHAQGRQVQKLENLRSTESVTEETFLAAKDQLVELEAALAVTKEQLAEAQKSDPNIPILQAEAAVAFARVRQDSAREQLSKHTLTAPCDGRILRLQVGLGQILGDGDPRPPIWFCPERPFVVRCEVEQEFADSIELGMHAEITNETRDNRRWTGRVQRVAPWVAPRRTLWNKTSELGEVPTVECIVRIDPDQPAVRIGQRVRVALTYAPAAEPATEVDREAIGKD
jgi:multidrug resistance efflux pump